MLVFASGLHGKDENAVGRATMTSSSPVPVIAASHAANICEWQISAPQTRADAAVSEHIVRNRSNQVLPSASIVRSPVPEGIVHLSTVFPTDSLDDRVVFAAVTIRSESASVAALLTAADDEISVFLNGEQIFTLPGQRSLSSSYTSLIPLKLTAGENHLVLKLRNIAGDWGFVCRFEPTCGAAAATLFKQTHRVVDDPILDPSKRISLFGPGRKVSGHLAAVITRVDTGKASSVTFTDCVEDVLSTREIGLYRVQLVLGDTQCSQMVFVGSFDELMRLSDDALLSLPKSEAARLAAAGYHRRLQILSDSRRSSSSLAQWDREVALENFSYKAVWAFSKLYESVSCAKRGRDPQRDAIGLSIRSFISGIDGQMLNYRLFVPDCYQRGRSKLPLVVVPHPGFTAPRPFIAGSVVANQQEAETWSGIAEELGLGVLWVGYRVQLSASPLEVAHIEEVLAHVAASYDVDMSRITLWGECSAAVNAWIAYQHSPGTYAGVLLLNASLPSAATLDQEPFPSDSLSRRQVLDITRIMSTEVPVFIAHDALEEKHGPLAHSEVLIRAAAHLRRKVDTNLQRVDWPERLPSTLRAYLGWLAKQRITSVVAVPPPTNRRYLASAFADPFVVVCPTAGAPNQLAAAKQLFTNLVSDWRRANFGGCRVVNDTDVDQHLEENYNLVLVGSAETNVYWNRVAKNLGVAEDGALFKVFGAPFQDVMAFEAWCPNPKYPRRKVVLLGGSDPATVSSLPVDLYRSAYVDAAVWCAPASDGPTYCMYLFDSSGGIAVERAKRK